MSLLSPLHLLVVALVALVVFGPRRLSVAARAFSRAAHEFRDALAQGSDGAGEQKR